MGAANTIADSTDMILSGGTFSTGGFTEAINNLSLTANSVLDIAGAGNFTLLGNNDFSSNVLFITGWVGEPAIGTTPGGTAGLFMANVGQFTLAELANVQFFGYALGATQLLSGEIIPIGPVPEASTYLSAVGIVLFGTVWHRLRMRRRKQSADL